MHVPDETVESEISVFDNDRRRLALRTNRWDSRRNHAAVCLAHHYSMSIEVAGGC